MTLKSYQWSACVCFNRWKHHMAHSPNSFRSRCQWESIFNTYKKLFRYRCLKCSYSSNHFQKQAMLSSSWDNHTVTFEINTLPFKWKFKYTYVLNYFFCSPERQGIFSAECMLWGHTKLLLQMYPSTGSHCWPLCEKPSVNITVAFPAYQAGNYSHMYSVN